LKVEPSAENLNAIIFKENIMTEKRIKKNHKIKISFSENIPPQNEELKARETVLIKRRINLYKK